MNDMISAISTVGFPIAACIGLAWFVYRTTQQAQEYSRKREEELRQIIDKQADSLKRITATLDAINNRLSSIKAVEPLHIEEISDKGD